MLIRNILMNLKTGLSEKEVEELMSSHSIDKPMPLVDKIVQKFLHEQRTVDLNERNELFDWIDSFQNFLPEELAGFRGEIQKIWYTDIPVKEIALMGLLNKWKNIIPIDEWEEIREGIEDAGEYHVFMENMWACICELNIPLSKEDAQLFLELMEFFGFEKKDINRASSDLKWRTNL